MATLAADAVRQHVPFGTDVNDLPVIAADIIYEGAAVGDNGAGFARPLVAGDPFRGFAEVRADNAAGAAGDIRVRVRRRGAARLSIAALAITDVGKDVFASDDDTFTLTQGANTRIGYVARWVSTGVGIVEFEEQRGLIVELTDNSTGSATGAIADVGGAFSQAGLNNIHASLVAKINALARQLGS